MTELPVSGLTWLLVCLMPSTVCPVGVLSPPQYLSLDLLDFQGTARWLSGPGNPHHTRYTLELKEAGEKWNQTANCTATASTTCHLFFENVFKQYFIRVKATWRDERSKWTNLSSGSFQPYGNTLLSPPTLKVLVKHQSIQVHVSHPVRLPSDVKSLRFSIKLFQNVFGHKYQWAMVELEASSYSFRNLTPGSNYCINATTIHNQQPSRHLYSEQCVDLPRVSTEWGSFVVVTALGVAVLLVTVGLALITMLCYLRPRTKDLRLPKALCIIGVRARVWLLAPDEPCVLRLSPQGPWDFTEGCLSTYEDEDTDSSHGYDQRECLIFLKVIPGVGGKQEALLPEQAETYEEADEGCLHHRSAYALAWDRDESRTSQEPEGTYAGMTDTDTSCPDASTSSLPVVSWEEAHREKDGLLSSDGDSDGNPGLEVQALSDSSGSRSGRLESLEEETDTLLPSFLPPSDYEPRFDPCSYDL